MSHTWHHRQNRHLCFSWVERNKLNGAIELCLRMKRYFWKGRTKRSWHSSNTCQHLESGSQLFKSSRLAWAMGHPGQVQDPVSGESIQRWWPVPMGQLRSYKTSWSWPGDGGTRGRQRQVDLSEFKASLACSKSQGSNIWRTLQHEKQKQSTKGNKEALLK